MTKNDKEERETKVGLRRGLKKQKQNKMTSKVNKRSAEKRDRKIQKGREKKTEKIRVLSRLTP